MHGSCCGDLPKWWVKQRKALHFSILSCCGDLPKWWVKQRFSQRPLSSFCCGDLPKWWVKQLLANPLIWLFMLWRPAEMVGKTAFEFFVHASFRCGDLPKWWVKQRYPVLGRINRGCGDLPKWWVKQLIFIPFFCWFRAVETCRNGG